MRDVKNKLLALSPEQRAKLAYKLAQKNRDSSDQETIPVLQPRPDKRHEPFTLTPLQRAYLIGRTTAFEMSGIASRGYFELNCPTLDLPSLAKAWNRLIQQHEMLGLKIYENGMQEIPETTPIYTIDHLDAQNLDQAELGVTLERIREEMMRNLRPTEQSSLTELRTTQISESETRLHVCFDLLNVDGGSVAILFREFGELYLDPDKDLPAFELSFRDYVLHEDVLRKHESYQKAREYWIERIDNIPLAPSLPTAVSPTTIEAPKFTRYSGILDTTTTDKLKARAREIGVSNTTLLLTAYVDILRIWSGSADMTINIPVFKRLPVHPEVEQIVGAFTSINLLAVEGLDNSSFSELAQQIQGQLLDDLAHLDFDGVEVQRELARRRGPGEAAMPIVFTGLLEHDFANSVSTLGEISFALNQTAQVWMDLHVDELAGQFLFKWDAVDGLFPQGMVEAMLAAYCQQLESFATGAEKASEGLLPDIQQEVRTKCNATEGPYSEKLAHELFQDWAERQPEHPALIAGDQTLSYEKLRSIGTQIGRLLRDRGAKPDELVAIIMPKGWRQIASVVGILNSGAAYLPIDPEQPQERISLLLKNAAVRYVLTQTDIKNNLEWSEHIECFCVDNKDLLVGIDDSPLASVQTPSNLAYVLYTSGSTGLPKGVMIEHRSIVNRMTDVGDRFGIGPEDRIIAVTALHHDLSVFDIFAGLGAGATLVIPDAAARRDPAHWAELVRREKITLWNSVPAFMEMFVEYLEYSGKAETMHSLRHVMHSGDWVPVSLPERVWNLSPTTEFTSLGGPTETTVWDIFYPVTEYNPEWKSIPYGKPLRNATYYVLDAKLQPCPDWVTGEMYIGGVGLARGYWEDEEKTNEKFIEHPESGERLYRSGDLGRYLPDGNLEFMGRTDFQVKIQGQRIELGEIESAIIRCPGVHAAIATVFGDDAKRQRLVGYVVTNDDSVTPEQIRQGLETKLPAHMIPTVFEFLEELPLSKNGKVDRKMLPEPSSSVSKDEDNNGAVDSEIEKQVAEIVRELLAEPNLDPDVSLIEFGANSIDLVRLGNQLESAFGDRPRIDEIFRLDSIRAIAGYYSERDVDDQSNSQNDGLVQSEVAALISSFRVMIDPDERDEFKNSRPGVRRLDEGYTRTNLPKMILDDSVMEIYRKRRSARTFSLNPVPIEDFSRWLNCVGTDVFDDKAKYRYGSAGSLYPNQIYLHIKAGRVEGLSAGTYYYQPIDHSLVLLEPVTELSRDIHIPFVNTPVFDEAGFSVFIVAELAAIAPSYGERSMHFVTVEAGLMTQLLDIAAVENGIGLCQMGTIEFDLIRDLFHLEPSQILIHSLVGGRPEESEPEEASSQAADSEAARLSRMVDRVKNLSPEEVQTLLKAKSDNKDG